MLLHQFSTLLIQIDNESFNIFIRIYKKHVLAYVYTHMTVNIYFKNEI